MSEEMHHHPGVGLRPRVHRHITRNHLRLELTMAGLGITFFIFSLVIGEDTDVALVAGIAVTAILIMEFAVRFWAAPRRTVHLRRHWIDLALCLPFIAGLRFMRGVFGLRLPSLVRTTAHLLHVGHNGQRTAVAAKSDKSPTEA